MIKTEIIDLNKEAYYHNYSDAGLRIRKIGTQEIYDDALDLWDSSAQYEETDQKIVVPEVKE